MPARSRGERWATVARHGTAGALAWWIVVEGRSDAWLFGVPVVMGAMAASLWMRAPEGATPRLRALPGFLGWFVIRSLRAGVDVALRAFRRPLSLDPGFVTVRVGLPEGRPRVILAGALTLFPGTLSVRSQGEELLLHVLDRSTPVESEVRELESQIAALLGVPAGKD